MQKLVVSVINYIRPHLPPSNHAHQRVVVRLRFVNDLGQIVHCSLCVDQLWSEIVFKKLPGVNCRIESDSDIIKGLHTQTQNNAGNRKQNNSKKNSLAGNIGMCVYVKPWLSDLPWRQSSLSESPADATKLTYTEH